MHAWRYHRESNNEPYKHETPIKPLDDASSICETWYTWIRHEFLMNLLTDFCDGTTFHHLWDQKILSKLDTEFYTCLNLCLGRETVGEPRETVLVVTLLLRWWVSVTVSTGGNRMGRSKSDSPNHFTTKKLADNQYEYTCQYCVNYIKVRVLWGYSKQHWCQLPKQQNTWLFVKVFVTSDCQGGITCTSWHRVTNQHQAR